MNQLSPGQPAFARELIDVHHRTPVAAHKIYFHLTWSTHRRMPMIDGPTRNFLDGFFRRIAIQERTSIIALAFLRSHVHLLVQSGPRVDLSRLVNSSKVGAVMPQADNPITGSGSDGIVSIQ